METDSQTSECPICCKDFPKDAIEVHVNRCIFLNTTDGEDKTKETKRSYSVFKGSPSADNKRKKLSTGSMSKSPASNVTKNKTFGAPKQNASQSVVELSDEDEQVVKVMFFYDSPAAFADQVTSIAFEWW